MKKTNAYCESGVDVNKGYELVNKIKSIVKTTNRKEVLGEIGSFGGCFDLSNMNYKNPVLVSGTDGVGTKLLLAKQFDKHDTIGIDCVAMCVNDILAQGAEPLFFLDYIACGKNNPDKLSLVVEGVANGCKESGMALIGGETAEMPGMYDDDEYDLAGFAVGIVDKNQIISKEKVKNGNVLIGLPSSGIHSNGYSLVRKLIKNEQLDDKLREELIKPTKIYVKTVMPLIKTGKINGIAHITGGGLIENIPRILNENQCAVIDKNSWEIPQIFQYLSKLGNISFEEMVEIFNVGIGMVLIVEKEDVNVITNMLEEQNEQYFILGKVEKQTTEQKVMFNG